MNMSIGDYPLTEQESWWEIEQNLETRPEWGHYVHSTDGILIGLNGEPVVYGWMISVISYKNISLQELRELTKWCKENIDNVWEGPIGYLGEWRFRFTTQEDRLAFKLIK